MKKNIIGILIICFLVGTLANKQLQINRLEDYISQNEYEEVTLELCPLCNGEVIIKPVDNSFYIECNRCELNTDFFDSKERLVTYWNKR